MIQVVVSRKNLYKIIDITEWTGLELEKFLKAYMDRTDYTIQFRRTVRWNNVNMKD